MSSQETYDHLLKPTRVSLLRAILSEYSHKIRLDGYAQLLTSNPEIAETVAQWIKDEKRDQLNSITAVGDPETGLKDLDPEIVKAASITVKAKPKTDIYTHAISHVGAYDRYEVLWAMKRCFYALIPKGVAIVSLTVRNPVERILEDVIGGEGAKGDGEVIGEDELMILAEEATFERGKVRLTRREVEIAGDELDVFKKGLLERLGNQVDKNKNGEWREIFEKTWERETKKTGSLVIEIWLMVAMRWDLLCA